MENESEPKQVERIDYRSLAAEFGVTVTPEMQTVVDEIKALEAGSERFGKLLGRFQELAEAEIDRMDQDSRSRAQIGLIVATSDVLREAGMEEEAEENLEDARSYANNMGFDDLAEKLK